MRPRVVADLVPRRDGTTQQLGVRDGVVPHDVERRIHARCLECVEHPRGEPRVGSVIEGNRDEGQARRD